MSYSVGQASGFAGISVRTLHHYDRTGLLSPTERSAAGYRLYSDADLARLQQILFYRELGFSLEETAATLRDPGADVLARLRERHRGEPPDSGGPGARAAQGTMLWFSRNRLPGSWRRLISLSRS